MYSPRQMGHTAVPSSVPNIPSLLGGVMCVRSHDGTSPSKQRPIHADTEHALGFDRGKGVDGRTGGPAVLRLGGAEADDEAEEAGEAEAGEGHDEDGQEDGEEHHHVCALRWGLQVGQHAWIAFCAYV